MRFTAGGAGLTIWHPEADSVLITGTQRARGWQVVIALAMTVLHGPRAASIRRRFSISGRYFLIAPRRLSRRLDARPRGFLPESMGR